MAPILLRIESQKKRLVPAGATRTGRSAGVARAEAAPGLAMAAGVTYCPEVFGKRGGMAGPFVRWIAFIVLVMVIAATGFGAMGAG